MSAHTPGPWGMLTAGTQFSVMPVTKRGKPLHGRHTEGVCHGSTLADNWEADTRLIAAAPDMLAALRLAEAAMGNMDAANAVRAAIAKATGADA